MKVSAAAVSCANEWVIMCVRQSLIFGAVCLTFSNLKFKSQIMDTAVEYEITIRSQLVECGVNVQIPHSGSSDWKLA